MRVARSIEEFERLFLPDPEPTPEEKFEQAIQQMLKDFAEAIRD